MFPTDTDFQDIKISTTNEQSSKIGRSFLFDFKTGQHQITDGKVVECDQLQAIKQWLELLVRTMLDKYKVYRGTGFGLTWEQYIGRRDLPLGFIISEMEREVSEAAVKLNSAIASVQDFTVERQTRGLTIGFSAVLKDKQVLEVSISV
nr:MAG TPA: Protein of unknown function (DUF2634) [Caudoviricetes sp.]